MDSTLILQLILQLVLILFNAVFACAEIAVISMNDNKLSQMAANGDKRARRLENLTSRPAKFLATIQVGITLSGFLGSAFAADNFSEVLVDWIMSFDLPVSRTVLDSVSVIVITLVLSYLTLVFGELVPKRLAMKNCEKVALGMSMFISAISKVFAPIVWFLTASTNLILRILRIDPNAEDEQVSEEEIRMMVDVGSEKGVIDESEKEFIQNIFEFDDIEVDEFATHRTDMSVLWMEDDVEDWEQEIHGSRHSLYPICDETVDNITGVLDVKDYFRLKDRTKKSILENAVRPAEFVPESIKADVLFRKMKQTRNHFAVVLDEYGGVTGLVTMNDLLEQLVGDLDDDISLPEKTPDIEQKTDNEWVISGSAALEEVAEALDVELPLDDFDTFGGYVFGEFGVIPADGEVFEVEADGLKIKTLEIKDHRLEKALVIKFEQNAEDEE